MSEPAGFERVIEKVTCPDCGAELRCRRPSFMSSLAGRALCDGCAARRAELRERERKRQALAERAAQIHDTTGIPEEFRDYRRMQAWNLGEIHDWVEAHSDENLFVASRTSGIGKTWGCAHTALNLACKGEDVRWIEVGPWIRQTCAMMGYDGEQADRRIRGLCAVGLLVMDDLGTEIPTQRGQEIVFEIINSRTRSKYKRTWITSNCSGAEIEASLGPYGVRAMRRIRESFTTWQPKTRNEA